MGVCFGLVIGGGFVVVGLSTVASRVYVRLVLFECLLVLDLFGALDSGDWLLLVVLERLLVLIVLLLILCVRCLFVVVCWFGVIYFGCVFCCVFRYSLLLVVYCADYLCVWCWLCFNCVCWLVAFC